VKAAPIGAAAAADQQAIAGEGHAAVIQHVGQATARMAWRRAHQEPSRAKGNHIVLHQIAVGPLGAACRRHHDLAAHPPLEQRGAGHVIGMNMGFQCRDEAEA